MGADQNISAGHVYGSRVTGFCHHHLPHKRGNVLDILQVKFLLFVGGGKAGGLAKDQHAGTVFFPGRVAVDQQEAGLVTTVVVVNFLVQGSQVVKNAFGIEVVGLPRGRTLDRKINLMFRGRTNDVYSRLIGLFSTENCIIDSSDI